MKKSDLVFKELVKRGYHLEGKTRVWNIADSKLWYLTPIQAQGYLDIQREANYHAAITKKEVDLIASNLDKIVAPLPSNYCNIVDLGCGDGSKASLFIKPLTTHVNVRYYPIDISSYMVEKATQTIRKLGVGDVLKFGWNISDFENLENVTPLIRDKVYKNHLLLLLGNTLGNFERYDLLHGISESMQKGDVLLVGNGIIGKQEKDWMASYKTEKMDRFWRRVTALLGISPRDIEYDVRFVHSRVEELYTLKKDVLLEHAGKKLELKQGDVLLVGISYKFTKKDLETILKKFFQKVKLVTSVDETYALAICQK